MRKYVFYCDRCGKQTDAVIQLGSRKIETETGFVEADDWGAELCPDCFKEVDDMIAWLIQHPEIHFSGGKAIQPKKASNKKDLDLGKIAALRNAGWSMAKIADEMKCSEQTIRNHMDEAQAFLKNKETLEQMLEKDIQEV